MDNLELTYDVDIPPEVEDWIKAHLIGVYIKSGSTRRKWARWIKNTPLTDTPT